MERKGGEYKEKSAGRRSESRRRVRGEEVAGLALVWHSFSELNGDGDGDARVSVEI